MSEPNITDVQDQVLDSIADSRTQENTDQQQEKVEDGSEKQDNPETLLNDELKAAETLNSVVKDSAENARDHAHIDEELKELDANSEVLANIPRGEIFEPEDPDYYEQEKVQLEEDRKRAAARAATEPPETQNTEVTEGATSSTDDWLDNEGGKESGSDSSTVTNEIFESDGKSDNKQEPETVEDTAEIQQNSDSQNSVVSSITEETETDEVEKAPDTDNTGTEQVSAQEEQTPNINEPKTENVDTATEENDEITALGGETKTESNEEEQIPSERDFDYYLRLRSMAEKYNKSVSDTRRKWAREGNRKRAEDAENRIKEHTGGKNWEELYPDQVKSAEERRAARQENERKQREVEDRLKKEAEEKRRQEEEKQSDDKVNEEKKEPKIDPSQTKETDDKNLNESGQEEAEENKHDKEKLSESEKQLEAITKLVESNKEQMEKLEARMNGIEERLNKLAEKIEATTKTPKQNESENVAVPEQEQKPNAVENLPTIDIKGLSEEAADWKLKEAALKNKLYAANAAWSNDSSPSNYDKYVEAYDKLARHNTNAWHNDKLTKEGVYKPYEVTRPQPEVGSVDRSITISGNLVYNTIKPDKIKPEELNDIARTLMWERQKNPAVVDFQFAKGFRVNLWQMRPETRQLIEKKVIELGGNNYDNIRTNTGTEADSTQKLPETYKEAYEQLIKTQEIIEKSKEELEKQKKNFNLTLGIVDTLYGNGNKNEYIFEDLSKYDMTKEEAETYLKSLRGAGFYTGQDKNTGKYFVRKRY